MYDKLVIPACSVQPLMHDVLQWYTSALGNKSIKAGPKFNLYMKLPTAKDVFWPMQASPAALEMKTASLVLEYTVYFLIAYTEVCMLKNWMAK